MLPSMGYDHSYYDEFRATCIRSSKGCVDALLQCMDLPSTVCDFGCGEGIWCQAWLDAGVPSVSGMDGPYVNKEYLPKEIHFEHGDLGKPFSFGKRVDVVQCVEVAEHIPAESSAQIVDNLVSHANVVIFAAAPPGQGGYRHINGI